MIKKYQVFVSSTFNDLKDERTKVMTTLMEMDCIPAGMELFPASDEDQFEFIKKIINGTSNNPIKNNLTLDIEKLT